MLGTKWRPGKFGTFMEHVHHSDKFDSIRGKNVRVRIHWYWYTWNFKNILSLDTVFKKKSWDDILIKQSFIRLKVNLPSRSLTVRPSNVKSYRVPIGKAGSLPFPTIFQGRTVQLLGVYKNVQQKNSSSSAPAPICSLEAALSSQEMILPPPPSFLLNQQLRSWKTAGDGFPENHLIEKETPLNQTSIFGSKHLNFRACGEVVIQVRQPYPPSNEQRNGELTEARTWRSDDRNTGYVSCIHVYIYIYVTIYILNIILYIYIIFCIGQLTVFFLRVFRGKV